MRHTQHSGRIGNSGDGSAALAACVNDAVDIAGQSYKIEMIPLEGLRGPCGTRDFAVVEMSNFGIVELISLPMPVIACIRKWRPLKYRTNNAGRSNEHEHICTTAV